MNHLTNTFSASYSAELRGVLSEARGGRARSAHVGCGAPAFTARGGGGEEIRRERERGKKKMRKDESRREREGEGKGKMRKDESRREREREKEDEKG